MATPPTENFEWAESADPARVVEPVSQEAEGWIANQKPPSTAFNWLQRMWGRWIAYFQDDIENGRDPSEVTGGYKYALTPEVVTGHPGRVLTWNLTPVGGGFNNMTTNLAIEQGVGVEEYLSPTATGSAPATIIRIPLKFWTNTDISGEDNYEIWSMTARVKGAGTSTLTVELKEKALTGAVVTLVTWSPTLSGTITSRVLTASGGIPATLDAAKVYYLDVTIADSAAVTNVGLSSMHLRLVALRVS